MLNSTNPNINISSSNQSSRGFAIKNKRIVGTIDELESLIQDSYIRVRTQKDALPSHPEGWGFDEALFDGQDFYFIRARFPIEIERCLMMDDRITGVEVVEITNPSMGIATTRTICNTIWGGQTEVSFDVKF